MNASGLRAHAGRSQLGRAIQVVEGLGRSY